MNKLIISLVFLFFTSSFSQLTKIDSLVIGFVNSEDCKADRSSNYCFHGLEKIPNHAKLVISGIKICEDYNQKVRKLYEAYYKHRIYYIPQENVHTFFDYTDYRGLDENELKKLQDKAKLISDSYYDLGYSNFVKFILGTKGLAIEDHKIYDESEYTEGTSFTATIYNSSKKTIKYITFNVTGYNSVGDAVKDRRGKNISLKGIGPIEFLQDGTFHFEYTWFTDLVERVKLNFVDIIYMDGSKKRFSNIKQMVIPDELKFDDYGHYAIY